jgi:S1-C subfamily serine protease
VAISDVGANTPAAKAGLKKGDVITEYNDQHVEEIVQFRRMVQETPPGRTVQLSVWRDGHAQTISVEVGNVSARNSGAGRRFDSPVRGLTITCSACVEQAQHQV